MSIEPNEEFSCPYCGETNQILLDITGGRHQQLIVDCEVCCAPIVINITMQGQEIISINVRQEND